MCLEDRRRLSGHTEEQKRRDSARKPQTKTPKWKEKIEGRLRRTYFFSSLLKSISAMIGAPSGMGLPALATGGSGDTNYISFGSVDTSGGSDVQALMPQVVTPLRQKGIIKQGTRR